MREISENAKIYEGTIIEEDAFISVLVATTNDNTMGREEYNEGHVGGPHIKKNTTIGAAANMLPNTVIGENCIVGAGAVVTKDVPDHKVVMGVPAKAIRDVDHIEESSVVTHSLACGQYYVGQKGKFSKTISEADVYGFAGICGDFNPVHINEQEAGKSSFGKRIAHGMLGSSLISAVLGMTLPGPGTIYISRNLQFKAPIFIGDTIEAQVSITELMDKGKAKLNTQVKKQKGMLVIAGEAVVRLPGGICKINMLKLAPRSYMITDKFYDRRAA